MKPSGRGLGVGATVRLVVGCILIYSGSVYAGGYCTPVGNGTGKPIGKIISTSGATLTHAGYKGQAAPGQCLHVGSTLVTNHMGRLAFELTRDPGSGDKSVPVINLGPNSDLTLRDERKEADWVVELLDGWFRFFSGREALLDVDTPYVTAGVRGTEFALYTNDAGCEYFDTDGKGCSALWMQAGSVTASLPRLGATAQDEQKIVGSEIPVVGDYRNGQAKGVQGSGKTFGAGRNMVIAVAGERPRYAELRITPKDAVDWVLYYPSLVRFETKTCPETSAQIRSPKTADELRCAPPAVFQDTVQRYTAPGTPVADELVAQAAIRMMSEGLSDGSAARDLRTLLEKASQADGLALRSLVALKDNRMSDARKYAGLAVDGAPKSANAHLVMSYVLQAAFDLKGAEESTAKAAEQSGEPLILARQAELALALQEVAKALQLARKAVAEAQAPSPAEQCGSPSFVSGSPTPDPILARAYAVQGFAEIVSLNVKGASESFKRARCADDLSPLAYLGLGLTTIRQGDLDDGVRQLELAVALDPKVSLYRSYLGKGYFEQNQLELAKKQLELAKKFDAEDPTPYLYDAFLKRAQNDQIGALGAIEESKALNDNRAVYRSRLLLDSDDAVRSVSQGRIYEELGFERLTIPLVSESLATDPKNHSAHRALADVYRARPRQDIARVSETLQARVRQPLSLETIDPRLVDSRLLDSNTMSALRPSYAEYSRLFTGDGVTGTWGARIGSNSLMENQISSSLLLGRGSLSVAYLDLETDGYRDNNYRDQEYWNAVFQYQIRSDTQVQFEYTQINDDFGDPLIRFDMDEFFITTDTTLDIESWRVSVHHELNPRWDVTVLYREENADRRLAWQSGIFDRRVDEEGRQFEAQLTGNVDAMSVVTGGSYFDGDRLNEAQWAFPFSFFFPSYLRESTPEHFNVYAYNNVFLPAEQGFVTLGASYDQVKDGISDDNQYELNPKVAVVWNVPDMPINPTIRLAYFETLKRALLANQTLEPTTIAGFSQFYDDAEGAKTRVKAAAVDVPVPQHNLNLGVSWARRKIDSPILDFATLNLSRHDVSETEFSAHAYWHNDANLAVGLLLKHELFDRDVLSFGPEGIVDMEIDRVELRVNYSLEMTGLDNRVAISVVPQWLRQSGIFVDAAERPIPREDSDGYIVDVSASYQLPNRSGHVSLAVQNLFDRRFNFQDTDPFNPDVAPERVITLMGVFHVDI